MQVFTSILVLAIFFMAYMITDIRDYKVRKVKSITTLARIIGVNTAAAILSQDNGIAQNMLRELKNVAPEIVRADILDKNNNVFASYIREGAVNPDTALIKSHRGSLFADTLLYVEDDIINNKEFLGRVSLAIALSELTEIKRSKFKIAAILLVAALIISFFIALALQSYISKRLLYLVSTIKDFKQTEKYDVPAADNGKDEISVLVKTFNTLMKEVNESQQRKDEFIGIASHELKTPLTSIKGYLELLNAMETKGPQKQCVKKALESTRKLEKLIKDLLDVSKIQRGQLRLKMQRFNMDDLLDETIGSISMIAPLYTITREDENLGREVFADREKIEQVLINLLSNAVKYSSPQGKILVNSKNNGSELIIQVKDHGIGIPEDELIDIFDRFYTAKDSTVHISGLGLGLYICRDIVHRHNGKIWAEKEAKGSSFYFSLPRYNNA